MIRQYESKGMSRDEAIKTTIEDCIYKDILKEFLSKHGSEVHNMLFAEFNMEKELKVAEEIGIEKGRAITVIKLLTKKFGTLPEEVKTKISELDNATLEVIIDGIFEYRSLDDIKKYIE